MTIRNIQDDQLQFKTAMGQQIFDYKRILTMNAGQKAAYLAALGMSYELIREEINDELLPKITDYIVGERMSDLVDIFDGIVDSVYVLMNLANVMSLPFDAGWKEVHEANMAKRSKDGKVIFRADGKVLKPQGWQEPNMLRVLTEN